MKKSIALILALTMLMSSASVFAKEINLPKYEELDFEEALENVNEALEHAEKEKELFGQLCDYTTLSLAIHIINVCTSNGFNSRSNEADIKRLCDDIGKCVIKTIMLDPLSKAHDFLDRSYSPDLYQNQSFSEWREQQLSFTQELIEDKSKESSFFNFNLVSPDKSVKKINFSDINKEDWYYETVIEMTSMGLFNGKTEPINGIGTFAPNDNITSPEFIAVLSRMVFDGVTPQETLKWTKVNSKTGEEIELEGPWYGDYYKVLMENSVFPNDMKAYFSIQNSITNQNPITREEMATLIVGALHVSGMWKDTLYEDVKQPPEQFMHDFDKCSEYYAKNANIAYHAGIMTGDDNGNINPRDTATRAEAAAVLYRLYKLLNVNDN